MTRILFICLGNICRSPMAEFVMKDLVEKAGIAEKFEIASAATSAEEVGNPVYPPARQKLADHAISCVGKTARQMTRLIEKQRSVHTRMTSQISSMPSSVESACSTVSSTNILFS